MYMYIDRMAKIMVWSTAAQIHLNKRNPLLNFEHSVYAKVYVE